MPGAFVNKLDLGRLPAHNAVLASEGSAPESYGKGLMDEEEGDERKVLSQKTG